MSSADTNCEHDPVLVLQLKSEWKNTFGGSSEPEPLPAEYDPRNDESYDKVLLCNMPAYPATVTAVWPMQPLSGRGQLSASHHSWPLSV